VIIFLTVGSMLPFDRLVRAVDCWAGKNGNHEIFAQIGETDYQPVNFTYKPMIFPVEFRKRCSECDLIISHVGMGTVITAAECRKPLIALPRRPELNEVTSNHQLATARWLRNRAGIRIIDSEAELDAAIGKTVEWGRVDIFSGTRMRLVEGLRNFILNKAN